MSDLGEQQEILATPAPESVAPQPDQLANVPMIVPNAVNVEPFAKAAAHLQMWEKLRLYALKFTRKSDWHMFGDRPWPMRSACETIQRALGLNLIVYREGGVPYTRQNRQDDAGGYYIITVSGKIVGQWGELDVMGFCSSRDQFFAADGKDEEGKQQWKPLSQVKEENLIQAAYTNFVANAVMRYTGLSAMTSEDLTAAFGVGAVSQHTYRDNKPKATKEQTAADSDKAKRLWAILMIVAEGAEHVAKEKLKELSAFTINAGKPDQKQVPGVTDVAKLSPGRLATTLKIAEERWEKWLAGQGDQRGFFEQLLTERIKGGGNGGPQQ